MNCMSPASNLSDSSFEACQDCDVGSRNPPLDKLLVTGTPNTVAATMSSSAPTRIRRGAMMASLAIVCNMPVPPPGRN